MSGLNYDDLDDFIDSSDLLFTPKHLSQFAIRAADMPSNEVTVRVCNFDQSFFVARMEQVRAPEMGNAYNLLSLFQEESQEIRISSSGKIFFPDYDEDVFEEWDNFMVTGGGDRYILVDRIPKDKMVTYQ